MGGAAVKNAVVEKVSFHGSAGGFPLVTFLQAELSGEVGLGLQQPLHLVLQEADVPAHLDLQHQANTQEHRGFISICFSLMEKINH